MQLQREAAEAVLRKLQEHPDAWQRVDQILKESTSSQTKFFALQVLTLTNRLYCAMLKWTCFNVQGGCVRKIHICAVGL